MIVPPQSSTLPASTMSRRRLLTVGGSLGLLGGVAPLLSACGSKSGSAGGGSISVMNRWSDPTSSAAANALFAGFTKSSGVSVANQAQPSSGATYQPAVRTAFSSSTPPTMATDISGPEVFNLARAGVLMDLTDFYNSTIKARATSGATSGSTLDGKVWGLSDGASVGNCVWYNPQYLEKYKVDVATITTFDGWVAAMTEMKGRGGTPIVIGAKDQWPGGHYLNDLVQRALGSTNTTALYNRSVLPGQAAAVKWTDPEVVASITDYLKLKPLFQKGFLGEAQATSDSLFLQGNVGFYEMGSWLLSTMKSTPATFDVGVMLFPAIAGGRGDAREITLANDTLIVSKKADPKPVQAFFEYLTRPAVISKWSTSQLTAVPYKVDSADDTVTGPLAGLWGSITKFTADAGPDGAALFNDQAIDVNIYTKYIWQGSVGLMAGDVTPEQLCEQLEKATEAAQSKLNA